MRAGRCPPLVLIECSVYLYLLHGRTDIARFGAGDYSLACSQGGPSNATIVIDSNDS